MKYMSIYRGKNRLKVKPQSNGFFAMVFILVSIVLGLLLSFISILNDLSSFDWRNFLRFDQTWLSNEWMLLVSGLLFLVIILSSGFRYWILLNDKKFKIGFIQSLRFGILARYYVLITPWGLGSQPVLIGLIFQKGASVGRATASVMLDLLLMRLSMGLLVLIALSFYGHLVNPTILTVAWLGFLLTCLTPIFFVLASINPSIEKITLSIIRFFSPKQYQKWKSKISESLIQYRLAFKSFKHKKIKLFTVTIWSIISQLALLSLPFFILSTFPQTNFGIINPPFTYFNVLIMMTIANVVLGTVPTLGSAGAAEFTFTTLFNVFLSGQFLVIAILIWRFLLFYGWLIMGIVMTLASEISRRKRLIKTKKINFKLPLKVFIFNDGFYPLIDGVVKTIDAYARYLVSQGIDVTVIVPFQGDIKVYPYKIIAVQQVKFPGLFYPIPYGYNRNYIKQQLQYDGPAIYHAHTPFLLGHFALKLSRKYQIPLVTTFHSKYYDDYYAATKSRWLSKVMTNFTMRYFSKAFSIWTVSQPTVKTIRRYGLRHRGIKVIPNGTDMEPFKAENSEILNELQIKLDINPNVKTILFVGQLIWQKNLRLIMDSFKQLDQYRGKYQLVIVGEGRHEDAIKHYAKDQNLSNKIIFTGKIKEYQILSYLYGLANLFFFPSAYDNDPLVIKEAAIHALPALVMKHTSIAEHIKNDINGFVHHGNAKSFAKRIIHILNSDSKRKKVGLKARQDLAKQWPETLKNLVKFYRQVIKNYYS